MAWIELHQSLWTHRKTLLLAAELDLDETYAGAHVARLWTWALDNAPEGDLSGLPPRVIAFGAAWKGDAAVFTDALVRSGWLERDGDSLRLHDWEEYAGRLIAKRQANADRMRAARATQAPSLEEPRAVNVQRTCAARSGATGPNRTGPDRTGPETEDEEATTAVVVAPHGATTTTNHVPLARCSKNARAVLEAWRSAHGKRSPPKLNPTQAGKLEEAVADLGVERLLDAVQWSAAKGVTEFHKCLSAARTKRQQEDTPPARASPERNGYRRNGLISRQDFTDDDLRAGAHLVNMRIDPASGDG